MPVTNGIAMKNKQAAIGFIFITLLIDVIGLGIIIPVMPALIMDLTQLPESKAAPIGGWLLSTYAVVQFFFAPIIGGLSDRFGRRPVLLASLLGFGLDYIFLAYAPTLAWIFVGRFLAGIMGASFTTAGAYIADVSETPEERGKNFGVMGAAFGLGFIIGPMIGGLLANIGDQVDPRLPFKVAAALSLINFLYGYFILPESHKPENVRSFDISRANPFGTLKQLFKFPVVAGLLTALGFLYIAVHAVQSNWSFYTMLKFNWGPKEIGISLGVIGLATSLVQGLLIRFINPKLGQNRAVYVGLALYALGFILFAFATQGWMMYAFTIVYCLGGIAGPALQGVMSGVVPPNAQGELQGGFGSLMSFTSIFGPAIMSNLLGFFTSDAAPLYFPGAALLFGAILSVVASLLARQTLKKYAQSSVKTDG